MYLAEPKGWKLQSEDWATSAEDLKQLVERTYPDLQEDAREQLTLTHYLGQLEHQQLAFSVKQKRPKSVHYRDRPPCNRIDLFPLVYEKAAPITQS